MKVYIVFEDFRDEDWDETYDDVVAVYDTVEKAKHFLDFANIYWESKHSDKNSIKTIERRVKEGWLVAITDEHNCEYVYRCIEEEVQ